MCRAIAWRSYVPDEEAPAHVIQERIFVIRDQRAALPDWVVTTESEMRAQLAQYPESGAQIFATSRRNIAIMRHVEEEMALLNARLFSLEALAIQHTLLGFL